MTTTMHHSTTYLWICCACPGCIHSFVGNHVGNCIDKAECLCCLQKGQLKCKRPDVCCKGVHQLFCSSCHCSFPCDDETPCGCMICNQNCCGKPPGHSGSQGRQGLSTNDIWKCCGCPGVLWGLYTKCPDCIGCHIASTCCCLDQVWEFKCVTPRTCCKCYRQCCCCEYRGAIPCDDEIPLIIACCSKICCGNPPAEVTEAEQIPLADGKIETEIDGHHEHQTGTA